MPLLNMKKSSGKATKVAVSLDASLYDELELYCKFQEEQAGEEQAASAVIRECVQYVLTNDKDFAAFKKRGPAPKKAAEATLNGAQQSESVSV